MARIIDTFEQHLKLNDETGCMEWQRSTDKDGYGYVQANGKLMRAHRVAYQRAKGPIPKGDWVLHRCDNPRCCNPDHLFLGDCRSNVDDKVTKGRHAFGEKGGRAKLTEDQVRSIRAEYDKGDRQVDLAARYGVHQTQISLIVTRKEWAHVN